ncbi:ankyrin-1-like [Hydra vulgaris]|uniref:ankyrin-1-like n=1 Tax=Hydra vulgaris TaxID=6087 RepID=UPI0032EA1C15
MLAKLLYSCDQDEQTAFHLAVEKNHIEIVDLFIKNNCKVNSTNINMISPLHVACTSGFIELVKLLVDNAIVESKNLLKETPLHRAAMFNRVEIIDYLLSKGAQIDCRDKDNETPLLMAVRKNNVEAVKVLLDWFADITVKDLNDKTCMFIAAEANCKDVFEILCQYGAQILIEDFDKYEMTPLHIAAKRGLLNSSSFVNEAKSWVISPNEIQVSFDVIALTPIPIDKAIPVIIDILNNDKEDLANRTKLTLTDIHQLIELCLSQCYFLYKNVIRAIPNSGPIGLSLMVVVAEAFLQHLETKTLRVAEINLFSPKSFKCYVDDSHARFD